ncbi:hypothetical protein QLL95_gp1083 [Cotonvirus japonicus]|uniref:Uncharacterized protein n=1 Tax=Cotonvirus japonicus TaxID=2811091 RepID=A0ABM7NSA2_9VIRU|nr:hypothetical protein QLL95_gp1083 [Cotonvirus japonicus]BCS83040.1 hypothetical protein [Cotonvirus japonicus]
MISNLRELYDFLLIENAIVSNISSIYENDIIKKMETKLKINDLCYNNSLLHIGKIKPIIIFENDLPIKLLSFDIIFSVAKHNSNIIYKAPTSSYGYDFNNLKFHDNFFIHNPNNITTTQCNGYKCRNDFHVTDNGVWCESCHDDFDRSCSNLKILMHNNIQLSNIPFEFIIDIIKHETLININLSDLKNLKAIKSQLNSDFSEILKLHESINSIDDKIKKYVTNLNKQKQLDEQMLEKKLKIRNVSIETCINFLSKFDDFIDFNQKKLELSAKEETIKKLELEISKKQEDLNKLNEIINTDKNQCNILIEELNSELKNFNEIEENLKKMS